MYSFSRLVLDSPLSFYSPSSPSSPLFVLNFYLLSYVSIFSNTWLYNIYAFVQWTVLLPCDPELYYFQRSGTDPCGDYSLLDRLSWQPLHFPQTYHPSHIMAKSEANPLWPHYAAVSAIALALFAGLFRFLVLGQCQPCRSRRMFPGTDETAPCSPCRCPGPTKMLCATE